MWWSNAYVRAALAAVLLVDAGYAQAAPDVLASAEGGCPTQRELERSLAARGLRVGASDYLVLTRTGAEQVMMQLVRNGSEILLSRQFVSGDCRAIAEAAAVVVEAYFVDVRGWSRQAESREPNELPSAVTPVQPQVALPRIAPASSVPSTSQTPPALPVPAVTSRPSGNTAALRVPPTTAEYHPSTREPPQVSAIAFLGLGPAIALPKAELSAQFEAGGGIELGRIPLSIELQLATTLPSISGAEPNRVRRWPSQALARVGLPLGSWIRYRPWAGVGASIARVRALDLAASPTRSTAAGLMGGGVELAWPIVDGWSGRVDASCLILSARDAYRIEPDGEIGRGPRVVCSLMVGIRIGGPGPSPAR